MSAEIQPNASSPKSEAQEIATLHRPESPESRESPYADPDLEKKIGFLKTFMHAYQALPIPNANKQTDEDIRDEVVGLGNVLFQTQVAFEDDVKLLIKKRQLEDESRSLIENVSDTEPDEDAYKLLKNRSAAGLSYYISIEKQIARLESNPNVNFLDYFESMVEQLVLFRAGLRDKQSETGSILDENGWVIESELSKETKSIFGDPEGMYGITVDDDERKIYHTANEDNIPEDVKDNGHRFIPIPANGVQYTRSSIIYYVNTKVYEKIFSYTKPEQQPKEQPDQQPGSGDKLGFQLPGTNIVFINDYQEDSMKVNSLPIIPPGNYKPDYLSLLKNAGSKNNGQKPEDIVREMQTTAKHEDFHSLFVGFRNLETSSSPLSVPELEFDIINKLQIYRDRLKDDFKPTFPKYPDLELRYKEFLKKQLIHEIEKLINISSEELLAELFSDPDRTNIPKDTFKGYDLKTEVRVKKLFGLSLELENSCIKEIYDTVKPKFNFEGAIETIKRLYVNIAEKCPERSKDLDYALILIPISEIATLEQLVGEWLKAA